MYDRTRARTHAHTHTHTHTVAFPQLLTHHINRAHLTHPSRLPLGHASTCAHCNMLQLTKPPTADPCCRLLPPLSPPTDSLLDRQSSGRCTHPSTPSRGDSRQHAAHAHELAPSLLWYVCVLSRWVHSAVAEVSDLPSLKCSSHWSLGLYPASVELILWLLQSWLFCMTYGAKETAGVAL
jgi:hypothetical protein